MLHHGGTPVRMTPCTQIQTLNVGKSCPVGKSLAAWAGETLVLLHLTCLKVPVWLAVVLCLSCLQTYFLQQSILQSVAAAGISGLLSLLVAIIERIALQQWGDVVVACWCCCSLGVCSCHRAFSNPSLQSCGCCRLMVSDNQRLVAYTRIQPVVVKVMLCTP